MRLKKKGFTLIEVLLVIIIVGILATIVLPRIIYDAARARKEACQANIRLINAQVELWHLNTGQWPLSDLSDIFASKSYFPDGPVYCPVAAARDIPAHSATYSIDNTGADPAHRVIRSQHP